MTHKIKLLLKHHGTVFAKLTCHLAGHDLGFAQATKEEG